MGESITEGAVAALLKAPGDAVAMDEPILQIETDKVTIDVRAPQGGVLSKYMVGEGDDIAVGQTIAEINTEGASAAAAAPAPAAPAQEAAPKSDMAPARRQPSIRFPPRRTPDGVAISSLPREEAARVLAQMQGAADGRRDEPAAAAPAPTPPQAKPAAPPAASPSKVATAVESQHPPRRTLSEREMEAIMLGGVEP